MNAFYALYSRDLKRHEEIFIEDKFEYSEAFGIGTLYTENRWFECSSTGKVHKVKRTGPRGGEHQFKCQAQTKIEAKIQCSCRL